MNASAANVTRDEAAAIIRDARRVLVTTHAKPDGDAFGAVVALTAALRGAGHEVEAWFTPPVLESLKGLPGADLLGAIEPATVLGDADLVLVADTAAWSQLAPLRPQLESRLQRMLIVDHHISGDVAARWRLVDDAAAACCEMVLDLLDALGLDWRQPVVRDVLLVGIAADTGWFRFSNTRPRTLRAAASLLEAGVDHAMLHARLEQSERPQKMALLARALSSLRFLDSGRMVLMVLRAEDFVASGADVSDTDRFVDIPQMVGRVQAVALVTEPPAADSINSDRDKAPPVRVSLRSKAGPGAVNVALLAGRFGGGGHARAAGAKIAAPVDEVIDRLTEAFAAD